MKLKSLLNHFYNKEFIMFIIIGIVNAFNGIWISYVYSLFINDEIIAYVIGFITSLCISYVLNSVFNFKTKLSWEKFIRFVINNIPNFIIQMFCLIVVIKLMDLSKLISYAITAIIAFPITYLLVKINVFKKN